jgi:hypothetical protein
LQQENKSHLKNLAYLQQKKNKNTLAAENVVRLKSLPDEYVADKVIRYERSLHKSIMQNVLLLKKLQVVW